ncbi:4-vinyl reductase [Photobacterium sp. SDRW27]|uniref:4-vinyl reductase n=1 Tax=Photobacterium obscurum TaxID=2829490 RepID=UPI0022442811|nr:4-vinyl reductase [Photobacterium obscurum]MCW8328456.1 4-vinyl reductase [Photobacterium obscurum]
MPLSPDSKIHAPEVPIEVDSNTGVWSTNGLPMLYVPRHFFINNHTAVESALGAEKYAEILYDAGYQSAYYWCEKESETHGLQGSQVFEHYMKRLSQRGWGQFVIENLDISKGRAKVRLYHSAFVYHYGKVDRKVDYMFTGWFAGAMDQITRGIGQPIETVAIQQQSEAQTGCDYGLFEVMPRDN